MDIPRTWRLRDERYLLQGNQCQKCQKLYFPKVVICSNCRSRELSDYQFSGKGEIYSYSTVYQAAPSFGAFVPYIVALIDLEEGPRVTAQLSDISPEEVEIGIAVEMVVRKISEDGERGVINYGYKFRPPIPLP